MTLWAVLVGYDDDYYVRRIGGVYTTEKGALAALRVARDEGRERDVYHADWWVSQIVHVDVDGPIMQTFVAEQRTWDDPLRADELTREETVE